MTEKITTSNNIVETLKESIDCIVQQYKGTQTLILFQGLGNLMAHLVLEHEDSILNTENNWFDEDNQLSLKKIVSEKQSIFQAIVFSKNVLIGIYEQVMPIRGSLSELYNGQIVIVKNNLFDEKMPTAVSTIYLAEFGKMLENPEYSNDMVDLVSEFYADVVELGDVFLVSPIQLSDEIEKCETRPLFVTSAARVSSEESLLPAISAPSPTFLTLCCSLCEGEISSVCLKIDASFVSERLCVNDRINAVWSVLLDSGVDCEIVSVSRFDSHEVNPDRLLPLLKKYWGVNSNFRELPFYRDPDCSREIKQVSQGYIADQVVLQAESAIEGSDSFQNIFVTAPTGAGKSLLFQLAALYLAEEYKTVTIVIEPLIALMEDQIKNLRERGVMNAAALNSNLSFSERLSEIEKIKNGEISLVYLSPELLLGSNIEEFIGERNLGLVVIDEVHTVTLWGKNFRSDYWFLGDYLSKLRRSGRRFPVFCLTATAVYGGADDVVFDIIEELELGSPKIFLGKTRRDNISFGIDQREKKDYSGPIESVKYKLVVDRIKSSINSGRHALVYCPFVSHVNEIVNMCEQDKDIPKSAVMRYHGRLDKDYKNAASKLFEQGKCRAMVCTTAYGMGVDIEDIEEVIHFAPTGNLSNYVQEIGRGARNSDLHALATIDFFRSDSRFYAQLHSMSSLRQKQLKEIMKKLYALYAGNNPRRQNILVSPGSFSYLFGNDDDAVDKVKTALMMIAKDLLSKYGFPVLIVKSKPSYTKNYICIPFSLEEEFIDKYSCYLRKVLSPAEKTLETNIRNKWTSEVRVRSIGDIYELDSAKMWEERFSDLTFAEFKWKLFNGNLITSKTGDYPSPRFRLEIMYKFPAESICERFQKYIEAIQQVLYSYKTAGTVFRANDFKKAFVDCLNSDIPFGDFPEKVLDAFTMSAKESYKRGAKSTIRCLQKRSDGIDVTYRVAEKSYVSIDTKYMRLLKKCLPANGKSVFWTYLSRDATTQEELDLAILLELFGLATYETRGGDDPELFVRLNDPNKINALANDPRYRNDVLFRINERHRSSKELITKFFWTKLDDNQRWDLIEAYFLGESDEVAAILEEGSYQEVDKPRLSRKQVKHGLGQFEIELLTQDANMENMSFSQIWNYGRGDTTDVLECQHFDKLSMLTEEDNNFEKPIYDPEMEIVSTSTKINPLYAWPKSHVMLFLEEDASAYAVARESNWRCFIMGKSFVPEALLEEIRL